MVFALSYHLSLILSALAGVGAHRFAGEFFDGLHHKSDGFRFLSDLIWGGAGLVIGKILFNHHSRVMLEMVGKRKTHPDNLRVFVIHSPARNILHYDRIGVFRELKHFDFG